MTGKLSEMFVGCYSYHYIIESYNIVLYFSFVYFKVNLQSIDFK